MEEGIRSFIGNNNVDFNIFCWKQQKKVLVSLVLACDITFSMYQQVEMKYVLNDTIVGRG